MNTLAVLITAALAGSASEQETWEESYSFDPDLPPVVQIENVWGDVTVTTHNAPTVEFVVEQRRSARDAEWLDRSRDILRLRSFRETDGVTLTMRRRDGEWEQRRCKQCRLHADIEVRVPAGASVIAGTVNDGAVRVEGVRGTVTATNVNGPVTVVDAESCDRIASVNGRVKIDFATTPDHERCTLDTINGDMHVALPEDAHADFRINTNRGKVTSAFELEASPEPPKLERVSSGKRNQYRLTQGPALRLGAGGAVFEFESMNGDVSIDRRNPRRNSR
ncbi:MAG: hypothetical protein AAGE01_05585 [Pseudomonadota bacterium]